MFSKIMKRILPVILTLAMTVGMIAAVPASAAGSVSDYDSFLTELKVLETYADAYVSNVDPNKDPKTLVLNYIRTGVERYTEGLWNVLAGDEITAFTAYVAEQDAANGTTVENLRDIIVDDFRLPNGNQVDFGHMFGTLNISYINSSIYTADLAGWSGDICDLISYSKKFGNVPAGTVDEMAAYVLENCFGVDADNAFGMDDFYGDLDAFYLMSNYKGTDAKLSDLMTAYFTDTLSDVERSAYFMNNRFKNMGLYTHEDVRGAVLDAYMSNTGLSILETDEDYNIDRTADADLITACCYAFADYVYGEGGDLLNTGDPIVDPDDPEDPDDPDDPSGGDDEEEETENPYFSVFSTTESILAPGITQKIEYAQTVDKKQIVYYVATVDVTRDDVTIMANYRDNDPSKGWGMQRVEEQAKALVAKHSDPDDPDNYIENFNAIVATNADGYNMATGQPGGLLVMEGVEWYPVDGDGFFAILKDGSAMIGSKEDYETYKDQIQEGIGGFGATLVVDGEICVNRTEGYYTTRASRTAIGITADGKVVMMVLDGRQEPFSAGGSMEEIAQIMYEAGCVHAINLDGGGSTTYMSKPEGQDNLVLVNRPSDGYARSVATSLVAVSTAKSSKEFDHANISSEYEYITPGTSMTLTAKGVSNTGSAAVMPEGAYWAVSDETIGSITADGVFTSALELGTVDVQIKTADGTVVGEKTINVVAPDKLVFTKDILNATYGEPTKLPLEASYNGNLVLFNPAYITVTGNVIGAITSEGDVITALESSGVRAMRITAALVFDGTVKAEIKANFYKPGESSFDFDNVTYGDRQFAWLRELSNSETFDGSTFYTVDSSEGHTLEYTFAIDMTEIQIPEQLNDIIYMLPGADAGSTAWDYLLRLAERVSVLSEVRITAQFDPDLEIDISELTVVNEYFYLRDAQLDESNNKLTIICGWHDQTATIDPSTANPMCILNGIIGTPKADAGDTVAIVNSGNISYNIFLRASSLYSFACKTENQEKYGLVPFDNPDVIINGGTEKGASFGSVYATFNDSISLVRTDRNGWYNFDSQLYYYVDNKPISAGIHLLPSFEDPSVKYYYEFIDNGVLVSSYTGFIGSGDNLKYALLGVPQTGWITVTEADGSEAFYYFSPTTYNAVNGEQIVDNGFKALFVDYKCVRGDLVKNELGLRYRFGGAWQRNQWIEYEGKYYYFDNNYYALNANSDGQKFWIRNINGDDVPEYHIFDENCVWRNDMTGIYYENGGLCFIRNGVRVAEAGIVYLGGNYYYFMSNTRPVISGSYWPTVELANGLVPGNKQYFFDEYGRMTNVPATAAGVPDGNEGKNGVYTEADGTLGYYIYGAKRFNMGLVELTDDVYIYVDRYGALAVGECEVTKTNGLLAAGTYTFDENGIYTPAPDLPDEPDEPDVPVDPDNKNGIIEENGVLYYYIDGVLAEGAGLVEVEDGVLIYVRADGRLALGLYWPTVTNGLLPLGKYDFGDNGKYTLIGNEWGEEDDDGDVDTPTEPEEPDTTPKNGIVLEDGVYYYYIDGVKAYCYGLLEIEDGVYIYVRSNGQLATGSYWPTNMIEAYLPKGLYDFGEDGRYIAEDSESDTLKNGIVEEDGVLRYYVDGRVAYAAGLIEIEKNVYIYVRSSGVLATGKYWPTNSNGLLTPGVYNFGTDGKYVKG